MAPSRYLLPIGSATVLSWIAVFLVITKLDPCISVEKVCEKPNGISIVLFFTSLFFALTSLFTIIGFYFRQWLNKSEIGYNQINVSLRQGILLSLCTVGCLLFLLLGVLTWWDGLLLVAIITLIEFYFTSKE